MFQAMGDGRIQDSGAGKSFLERSRLINCRKMHPGKKKVTQVQGKCAEQSSRRMDGKVTQAQGKCTGQRRKISWQIKIIHQKEIY